MLVLQPHPLWEEGWSGLSAHLWEAGKVSLYQSPIQPQGVWRVRCRLPAQELRFMVLRGTTSEDEVEERPGVCPGTSARCPYLLLGVVVGVECLALGAHVARPAGGRGQRRGGPRLTQRAHGGMVLLGVTGQRLGVVRFRVRGCKEQERESEALLASRDPGPRPFIPGHAPH